MNKSQFTVRLPHDLMSKLLYISAQNIRSPNKEIEMLIKKDIIAFEKEHGPILLDDLTA